MNKHKFLFRPLTNIFLAHRQHEALQCPSEINFLQTIVSEHHPKTILELGLWQAGTISRWLTIKSADLVISLDKAFPSMHYKHEDIVKECKAYANEQNFDFYAIEGNSHESRTHEILSRTLEQCQRTIDYLFIDGDHSYEGVKQDFIDYGKFMTDGGIVAFHDIVDSDWARQVQIEVPKFWLEIKNMGFEYDEIKNIQESIIASPSSFPEGCMGIGVIRFEKEKWELFKKQQA